jgi:DNA polymerase III subunit delta'
MAWISIINQKKVKSLLQNAIINNRIAHAYCFVGIDGVGKEAVALEFAKTVNCDSPIISDNNIEACEKCKSCSMASKLQHPNIQLVYSLPTPKAGDKGNSNITDRLSDAQIQEIQEQNALKAVNPYHRITLTKSTQIKIADIREIKRSLTYTPNSTGRRMILVFRADEMTAEAANAFLKTLEETQSNTTIILTTSKPEILPSTILSRCQLVYFNSLNKEDLSDYLIKQTDYSNEQIELALSFGNGSLSKTLEFLNSDIKDIRNSVVDILRTSLKNRNYRIELIKKLETFYKEKDKYKTEVLLLSLINWLRDALTIIKTSNTELLINKDDIESLKKFAVHFAGKDLIYSIRLIENAISMNKKNVNMQLVLVNLFLNLRKVLLTN